MALAVGAVCAALVPAAAALDRDRRPYRMPEYDAPRPRNPFIVMNPRSGGGKVTKFGLADKAKALGAEVALLDAQIDQLVRQAAPRLCAVWGVGPETAASLLVAAGDNPERLSSEASFAALCGVSPLDAFIWAPPSPPATTT